MIGNRSYIQVVMRAGIIFFMSVVLLLACDSAEVNTLDTGSNDTVVAVDTVAMEDATPALDTAPLPDTAPIEDTAEPPDTSPPPDTAPAVDTHEEDLSHIDVTWT